MSRSYLNKYENGKSQTAHARERANGLAHASRVSEYMDDFEVRADDSAPVVITVPPNGAHKSASRAPMAQMMLFDQPVTVKLAGPAAPKAPEPAEVQPVQPAPRTLRPVPTTSSPVRRVDEFTMHGLLKGCGIGLATAAALLIVYLIVG